MKLGPIMMDVSGFKLTEVEKTQLAKPSIGGVILFTRNYQNINQVKTLIGAIRKINQDLLIAVDHEGGRVQRFREGFTHLPAMSKLGDVYDQNPEKAIETAFSCGCVLAAELSEIDVDFSFTPVLDLDYGHSSAIGDRAFHSNPEVVIKLAGALIKGLHEVGMKCVGKHFPGHGHVACDSHLDLPIDERPMNEIMQDILCFKI
jgi:beta-N-acetylhexosaminidase